MMNFFDPAHWLRTAAGIQQMFFFNPMIPMDIQRKMLDGFGHVPLLTPHGVEETDLALTPMPIRVFTPQRLVADDAAVVYFHGGGYVAGSITSHRPLTANLAKSSGLPVYSVSYRLAPEHPYPAALEDAEKAVVALQEMGISSCRRLILGGDSAGGALAVAACRRLQQRGIRPLGLMLFSPWVNPSERQAPWLIDPVINPLWSGAAAAFYRGEAAATDPGYAPLFANLRGLPPTLVQVGREEVLFEMIDDFVVKLRQAGVEVTYETYAGLWHAGQLMASVVPVAGEAMRHSGRFARSLLGV